MNVKSNTLAPAGTFIVNVPFTAVDVPTEVPGTTTVTPAIGS